MELKSGEHKGAAMDLDEKVAALFSRDTVLPAQYFDTTRRKIPVEPEIGLMTAILEDGVNCYKDNALATDGKRRKLFEEAEAWILAENDDWVFSFGSICETLGLNPAYLREGLIRWKDRRIAAPRGDGDWAAMRLAG